jgi:hypothetical protein
MRSKKLVLLLSLLIPLSYIAKANDEVENKKGDPSINGYVADAESKKAVQGVTVSITAGKEKKEFTTDASGNFKVPAMNSGEVTITLEKKGYKTYRKEGVMLREGVTLKLSFDIEEEEDGAFHPLLRLWDNK